MIRQESSRRIEPGGVLQRGGDNGHTPCPPMPRTARRHSLEPKEGRAGDGKNSDPLGRHARWQYDSTRKLLLFLVLSLCGLPVRGSAKAAGHQAGFTITSTSN